MLEAPYSAMGTLSSPRTAQGIDVAADAVDAALDSLRAAARGEDNVLYPMREALRALATVGEVSDALREVWGTYTPVDVF